MERLLRIQLSKGISLYGKFGGSFRQPLFIVVHGLPGNMDDELPRSAARWFRKHGFATFRFNLYSHQKDARQLMDCTLKTHAADLDAIVRYFRRKGVKKVFVAGHSFGGPTILCSRDQDFDAAALWDPSYKVSFAKKAHGFPGGKYVKEIDAYLMKWGINFAIGSAMAREVEALPWDSIARSFKVPFKIILAGNGILKRARTYLKAVAVDKDLFIVKGATHDFNDREGMREEVFRASEKWFRKLWQSRDIKETST